MSARAQKQVKDLDVSEIDKLIHEPVRLSIIAHLAVFESADALFLKNQIGLTARAATQIIYLLCYPF